MNVIVKCFSHESAEGCYQVHYLPALRVIGLGVTRILFQLSGPGFQPFHSPQAPIGSNFCDNIHGKII